VQAPAACPGCVGLVYDSAVVIPVQLRSTEGFIGKVALSVAGPSGVLTPPAWALPPVALNYGNAPDMQVVNVELYVMPGVAAGSYQLTLTATPLPGANYTSPVALPVVLTVTSGPDAAWRD
jgi:hypothetical protein